MKHRLTARIAGAISLVAVVLVVSIVVLAISIVDLRDSADDARQSERTLQIAGEVGALVVDAETGVRGLAITEQKLFLEPLDTAEREMPAAVQALLDRPVASRNQEALARSIADASTSYVNDYARPLAAQLEADNGKGRAVIVTAAGKRRVDAIRADIAKLSSAVRQVADDRTEIAESHAQRALVIAGVAGALALFLFGWLIFYLNRSVAKPIGRAATAAAKLGGGDLAARLTEHRADEIGQLSDAFNAMGEALQENAAELESQHAELETQNGELEQQAVELESQAVELEAQAAELEAGQHELTEANESLVAQTLSLEAASASLRTAHARVGQFARVAESLGRHTSLGERAETLLTAIGDMTDSPVGALYARPHHGVDTIQVVSRRGLTAQALPDEALGAESVAGRAMAERRTIVVAHPAGDLRLRTFGAEVAIHHELHTPLIHADDVIGVLSIGRADATAFDDDEVRAIEHLAEQGAVALANSLESERSQWLADLNRAVLDSAGDAIQMLGPTGETILWNPQMDRFVREVLEVGRGANDLDDDATQTIASRTADPEGYMAELDAMFADPTKEGIYEYQLVDTQRWVRRYTAPVHTRAGEYIGRIFVLSETTERHDAERIKDELMATVSHELRTPLSAILGFTELLMARDYDIEERREYLATVHQQASRLSDLISDFLDLQRLEHSDEGLTLKPLDLREILASQVKLFSAQSQRHALQLKAAQEDLQIKGDADRLRRALANLLSNAIKYSPNGGDVTVDAKRTDGHVEISVTDRGLGIPSAAQERIFDRFFRVDSSETSRIGGTGLGLSLVREIVRAHHGEVGFDSVEGQGSRFWMKVPAA